MTPVLAREAARDPPAQLLGLDQDPVPGPRADLGDRRRHLRRRDGHGPADPADELPDARPDDDARHAARELHVGPGRRPLGRDGRGDAARGGARRRREDPPAHPRGVRGRRLARLVRRPLRERRVRAVRGGPADAAPGRHRAARGPDPLRRRALLAVPRVDPGRARIRARAPPARSTRRRRSKPRERRCAAERASCTASRAATRRRAGS